MDIKLLIILIITIFFIFICGKTVVENFTLTEQDIEVINFPYATYVINLSETDEGKRRWPIISEKYPLAIRWPAVYGATYDMSEEIENGILKEYWDFGEWKYNKSQIVKMTPGELGVILSHYKLWKEIAKKDEPAIILEDDAISTDELTQPRLDIIFDNLPEDFDIYLLGYIDINPVEEINQLHSRVYEFVLMHSYVISPKGARKLLKYLPIDMPLDTWVSKVAKNLKIYRHNFYRYGNNDRYYSILINQKRQEKQIVNTNII